MFPNGICDTYPVSQASRLSAVNSVQQHLAPTTSPHGTRNRDVPGSCTRLQIQRDFLRTLVMPEPIKVGH
jgi:hypothetical protein